MDEGKINHSNLKGTKLQSAEVIRLSYSSFLCKTVEGMVTDLMCEVPETGGSRLLGQSADTNKTSLMLTET